MDAFITRKKRKSSLDGQDAGSAVARAPRDYADDEPTEIKLAMLTSLHPDFPQEALLDILLAHDGSVAKAFASLSEPVSGDVISGSKSLSASGVVSQTSLRSFARPSEDGGSSPKKSKLLSRKGATLHLFDPADIAEHTPCSIIHNFLPSDLANDLLEEMLEESKTFEKITFKLFDTVVSSPHTSSFYVESYAEMQRQKFEVNGPKVFSDRACKLIRPLLSISTTALALPIFVKSRHSLTG